MVLASLEIMIRVGVFGAHGRMGAEVCRAVKAADDMEFVAGVDVDEPREALAEAQVVVDFTRPDVVMDNVQWCLDNGIHAVVGTSGFDDAKLNQIREWLQTTPELGVLVASNFSIGAVLMMSFAEQAACFYEGAEIVELHHTGKVDAPSGTASATAARIADARQRAGMGDMPDATTSEVAGARGADVSGVHVHAVRLPGLVAHQEVLFGSPGETLTIRHDSLDRASFMPGVLAGVRHVVQHPGLTWGMDQVLGL